MNRTLRSETYLMIVWMLVISPEFTRMLAQSEDSPPAGSATVMEVENVVEVLRAGATVWDLARTNQVLYPGDQLRTGERSRTTVRLASRIVMRLGELSILQVPNPEAGKPIGISFIRGVLYFFHREKPDDFRLRTPTASAVIRGTEFHAAVRDDQTTIVTVLDGNVVLSNEKGEVTLNRNEQGIASPGEAPAAHAVIEADARNLIQWCLYYPGVVLPDELPFSAEEQRELGESLSAYRSGDLKMALALYPSKREPASDADRIYRAALWLSVGRIEEVDNSLRHLSLANHKSGPSPVLNVLAALKKVVAAVRFQSVADGQSQADLSRSSSWWLAESYYRQSQMDLAGALAAARKSVGLAPDFGFAWQRIAELEFSYGRTDARALQKSMQLAPRNAQAHALQGFILAGANKTTQALDSFSRAIDLDGSLGNGWLGRGLCLMREGHREQALEALQIAGTVEPQRALFRSYLAKALSEVGNDARAIHELDLAKERDAHDPTAYLYSSLLLWQQNRLNESIHELEQSITLNDNRALFRSQLLLDQDRAVRGANLARIYADAGLTDVSVREAIRAVNADYANYSAHLFLANSYNELRDPHQVNLRYETPWFTEYLLANLLAPVSAGTLSQAVSQQEYSKLFERDRFGVVSSTEYSSRGDWIQSAAQYGVQGNFGYALEESYRNETLDRKNGDSEERTVTVQLKQQLTPDTAIYLQAIDSKTTAGDLRPYYDNVSPFPRLDISERQAPLVIAGAHHQWSLEHHTLLLAGRLEDRLRLNNPNQPVLMFFDDGAGKINAIAQPGLPTAPLHYQGDLEIYPFELQHLWRHDEHQVTLGARYQFGTFDTLSRLGQSTPAFPGTNRSVLVSTTPVAQEIDSDFHRFSAYGYHHWQVHKDILLLAGVSYDYLQFPANFRSSPLGREDEHAGQLSPKGGFIWTVSSNTTLRGAYTESLGGVSLDQSVRLEPSQVAGFNQAYRSLIPEAVSGANAAPRFKTAGIALDQKFATGTYLSIQGEWLHSRVDRDVGIVIEQFGPQMAATTGEELRYNEKSVQATLNQLIGNFWSVGAQYRLSRAELDDQFTSIPTPVWNYASQSFSATMQQVTLFARCHFPNGFFAHAESLFISQQSDGYHPSLRGDDIWQWNAFVGYRFPHRQAELRVGILNLTSQDYRLNPLNVMNELPRERTFTVSLKIAL